VNAYVVTLQNETGGQREERVVASTATSASNQALLRCFRDNPKHTYRVLHAIEA
jgi:hypothetical protein